MLPRVKEVQYVRDYRLALTFTDDTTKELDFRELILGRGGAFSARWRTWNFSDRFKSTLRRGQLSGLTE